MEVDLRQSDDPFTGASVLSLLPQTLGAPPLREPPPSSQAHEVELVKCFLKSMDGESSNDILEQAKAVDKNLQCGDGLPENGKAVAPDERTGRQQGRRPALGRKRAQFSLKSVAPTCVSLLCAPALSLMFLIWFDQQNRKFIFLVKSYYFSGDELSSIVLIKYVIIGGRDSTSDVVFSSQIEHIEDPEEYFLVFEQLENAEKELKKLRGDVPIDPVQNDQKKFSQRRPGLLGKTASYKHRFSVTEAAPESCKTSQEIVPDSGSSSVKMPNDILCHDTAEQSTNTSGLPVDPTERGDDNKENDVNALLDNLLCSFKELGEGEEEALLRKSLHIKSIDVGKIHLPELTAKLIEPKASTKTKQNRLSMCRLPQASTFQARSPRAAISALYKQISLKDHSPDLYHLSPNDLECDPSGSNDKHSILSCDFTNIHYEISTPLDKLLTSHTGAEEIVGGNSETVEKLTDDSHCLNKKNTEQSQTFVDNVTNVFHQLEDKGDDMNLDNAISKDSCPEVEFRISGCCQINMATNLTSTENSSIRSDVNASSCLDMHNVNSNDLCPEIEYPTSTRCKINMMENLTTADHQFPADHSSLRSDDDASLSHSHLQDEVTVVGEDEAPAVYSYPSTSLPPSTDGQSVNTSILQGENDEVHRPQSFSQNKGRKWKPFKEQLKSKRQSLAGDGLTWQCGVRRSTRIRSRPLEFWRGERFLYGRIHESLATVIGVKCSSSGQEGKKQALKVKSFVSDVYADLVAQAAN